MATPLKEQDMGKFEKIVFNFLKAVLPPAVRALTLMFAWNWVMPKVFHLIEINFFDAWALLIVTTTLINLAQILTNEKHGKETI